jgi:hypothetical protein
MSKEKRYCLNCGKELIHQQKKYCSLTCSRIAQWENIKKLKIEKWLKGEWDGTRGINFKEISFIVKEYLLEKSENKCSNCGNDTWFSEPIPLEIHHKDGEWKNNSPQNLEVLCSNCHGLKNRKISFSNKSPNNYRTKARKERAKKGNLTIRG